MQTRLLILCIILAVPGCGRERQPTSPPAVAVSFKSESSEPVRLDRDSLKQAEQTRLRKQVLSIDSIIVDQYLLRTLLVGIWQVGGGEVASGWSDNYQFFPDGHFRFNFNQMDCAKRQIAFSGRWTLKSHRVILEITEKDIYLGGHMEPSFGSCASDSSLVDATKSKEALQPPIHRMLAIDGIRLDSVMWTAGIYSRRFTTQLDSVVFTRMKSDPADYR